MILVLSFLPLAAPVEASFLSDVWGVLTDPLKIGRGTSNIVDAVERMAIHTERLGKNLNKDLEERIDQIGQVAESAIRELNSTVGNIDIIIDDSLSRISDLQREIFKNTSELVKCSTEVSSDIVMSKLSGSLNDLGLRKPRVTVLGYPLFEVKFDKTDFDTPIGGFRKYQDLVFGKLSEIKPDDPAYMIADIYGEMQRTSDLVRCHYKSDNGLFLDLYQIELEYNRRGKSWVSKYDSEYRKSNP